MVALFDAEKRRMAKLFCRVCNSPCAKNFVELESAVNCDRVQHAVAEDKVAALANFAGCIFCLACSMPVDPAKVRQLYLFGK
jgi:hypothetical protein